MTGGFGNNAAGEVSSDNRTKLDFSANQALMLTFTPFFLDPVARTTVQSERYLRLPFFCASVF